MGMNASDWSVFISATLLIADVCTTPSRVCSEIIIGLILAEYNFTLSVAVASTGNCVSLKYSAIASFHLTSLPPYWCTEQNRKKSLLGIRLYYSAKKEE